MRTLGFRRLALAAVLAGLGFAAPASVDCATYGAGPRPGSVMLMFGPDAASRTFAWHTDASVGASEVRLLEGAHGAADDAAFIRKGRLYTGDCTTVDDPRLNRHRVCVPALRPGTYSYRLGGGGRCAYGRFTVRGNPGRVTIVNLNDAQTRDASKLGLWERTAACAAKAAGGADRIDFIVSGGDFYDGRFVGVERADGGKTGAYLQWGIAADTATPYFPGVPWVMVSGNHDWKLYETCATSGCQSLDYGNVHVATIPYAGGKLNGKYEKALAWLDADLAAAGARTGTVWTVVAMHWGPYTTGDHGRLGATADWAKRVGALCARRHVDLVLQAHDHTFVKTLPYRWDAAGFTERADDADVVNLKPAREGGCDANPRGTYYVSCGCAGHRVGVNAGYASDRGEKSYANRRYKIATGRLAVDSRYGKAGDNASSDNPVQMFGVLDVEGGELHYRFFVAEADGSATLYDRLDVRKGPDVPRERQGKAVGAEKGPGTTAAEFYASCVDCRIPELSGIPALMAAGDETGANRVFAAYVRKALRPERLLRDWRRPASPAKRKRLEAVVADTLAGKLTSCGYTHDFKGLENVDWVTNRHPEKYCEWPWQLNRQHCLTRLAEYYVRCERDEKVAAAWCKLVSGWIEQAPPPPYGGHPKRPVTWRTIDTGQRLEGWCNQIHAFIGSPALTDEFIVRFFRSVRDHARRLEKPMTDNNWRIMELNGLMHAALYFPFLSESAKWRELALAEYVLQLELQQYPDGFQFELSPSYHGVIHGDYSKLIFMLRDNGLEPPAAILDGVERALEVYPRLTRPDRRSPAVNDSSEVSTVGTMMAGMRVFPERRDFTWFGTRGKKGEPPQYLSCLLPYSGAAVFRSSWAEDAVWAYMDCSPFGHGHQHEDKLNVLLHAYGRNMIVDGGNYAYDKSVLRKYVVSTRAHNTIMVDGLGQNAKLHYRWHQEDLKKKADVAWKAGGDREVAEAAFTDGYGPEGSRDHTVHTRRLVFFRKGLEGLGPFFVVIDRLEAKDKARKTRAYDSLWHLEECALDLRQTGFTADFGDGVGLTAEFSDRTAKFADFRGSQDPFQGWLPVDPPNPHAPRAIPTPILRGTFAGAKRIVGVLHPHRGAESPIVGVEASPSVSSRTLVLVLRDGRRVSIEE